MTMVNTTRRAFLRGDIHARDHQQQMPWMAEDFLQRCERCDDCIEACEEQVLIRADGGYPAIDFTRGGCTFCGECVTACSSDALRNADQPPWQLKVFIGESCLDTRGIACRACGDACEQRAIHFQLQIGGKATPNLDTNLCNGCGSCIAVCPIHIIQIQEAA